MTGQLVLFAEDPMATRVSMKTKGEAGLTKAMPPGPERLLGELVKRGLDRGDLPVAARIVLALDEEPVAG